MPLVSGLIAILMSALGFVAKNQYVMKLALIGAFYALLEITITQVKNLLFPYLMELGNLSSNITFLLCKIDFFGAINLYISALLSIFVFKQIIGYSKG